MRRRAALNLATRVTEVAEELRRALEAPDDALAPAALAIARIEYPSLDADAYLRRLDRMGELAGARVRNAAGGLPQDAVRAFGEYLYDEQGFRGNREQYDDSRNSFLNEVLDRRIGIPISLATVYLEVARRAGLDAAGISFPGHFLVRVMSAPIVSADSFYDFIVVDPFHGGALLTQGECRQLLRQHLGSDDGFDAQLLGPATRQQIVIRMLLNLKRLYVRMQSLPQAHFISTLLLEIQPGASTELRDRGLLAYHLDDLPAALRDLEAYLRQLPAPVLVGARAEGKPDTAADEPEEGGGGGEEATVREQVQILRRRISGLN